MITDQNLNLLDSVSSCYFRKMLRVDLKKGIELVINQPEDLLKSMSKYVEKMHEDVTTFLFKWKFPNIWSLFQNGLINLVRASQISCKKAEELVLEFVQKHTIARKNPICGNSVFMDKRFIDKYMPILSAWLNYRIIDVSSIRELCRR